MERFDDDFHDEAEEGFEDGDGQGGDDDFDSEGDVDEEEQDRMQIAEKEAKQVLCSKIVVYVFLVVTAFVSATMVYFYIRQHEIAQMQSEFGSYEQVIGSQVISNMGNKYDIGESFSASISSFAYRNGLTFPNVTLPHFEPRCFKIRHLAQTDVISFLPLVPTTDADKWIQYSVKNQGWVREGRAFLNIDEHLNDQVPTFIHDNTGQPMTKRYEPKTAAEVLQYLSNFYAPLWQTSEPPAATLVNLDMLGSQIFRETAARVILDRVPHMSGVLRPEYEQLIVSSTEMTNISKGSPKSYLLFPLQNSFQDLNTTGFLMMVIPWTSLFLNILPRGASGLMAVVTSGCGISYSFSLSGATVGYLGKGDRHEAKFEHYSIDTFSLDLSNSTTIQSCSITFRVYPTGTFVESYVSGKPMYYCLLVGGIFFFTVIVFISYDFAVHLQQKKILENARRTQMIVSHLFPKEIQERLMKEANEEAAAKSRKVVGFQDVDKLHSLDREGVDWSNTFNPGQSKPIADLFPNASVMFAEIVGFTAWSSTREPAQVFVLLETIYHAFDELAAKRKVFKVETVGSSYVATVGLPDPRKDHALVISHFAKECLQMFYFLVKQLVVELGPGTEELNVCIGIHSGPVTAGVLRGERARFQLFGDTVNTASRMSTTGRPNMVQISQETADHLIAAGRQNWLKKRAETVTVKGKGRMQTYWLQTHTIVAEDPENEASAQEGGASGEGASSAEANAAIIQLAGAAENRDLTLFNKHERLVEWNCEVLSKLICQVVARRHSTNTMPDSLEKLKAIEAEVGKRNGITLDEVTEIVELPTDSTNGAEDVDPLSIVLDNSALEQLRNYVASIALMYRENPFHNFEHASHVTMSVTKLLSRIVAPEVLDASETLHDHTYGITSDPLTQLAVVLSALIHDVDHPGVPNAQLVREGSSLALAYKEKSIAEQNSVDLAWDLLMEDRFQDLRHNIYATESEFRRFRQMVVNTVLATDIMDKDLGKLRKERWDKAFSELEVTAESVNRKASIVIEHLIAASDVAHTMQHWHVYLKWNMRFFVECYKAYCDGRSTGKNPAESWYKGEMGFFDYYIIPLAKKLKDCGVFGVSSDEYLQFALANRKEWEAKGEKLVENMVESSRIAVRTGGETPQFDPHATGPSPYTLGNGGQSLIAVTEEQG